MKSVLIRGACFGCPLLTMVGLGHIQWKLRTDVKQENWTWYATGPGHGIQLRNGPHRGRLIIPCDHIEADTKRFYSHIIYSDDAGDTWHIGGITPQAGVNESTVAELADGSLVLNMRSVGSQETTRKISTSTNSGITWSDIYSDPVLIEPRCQASLLFDEKRAQLYFSNPADRLSRINMTVRVSDTVTNAWSTLRVLHSGPSAYSDLALHNEQLVILFEAGGGKPV